MCWISGVTLFLCCTHYVYVTIKEFQFYQQKHVGINSARVFTTSHVNGVEKQYIHNTHFDNDQYL